MEKLTVVTGWSPAGWDEYGRRFWESFDRYWPPSVDLVVYGESPRMLESRVGRKTAFRTLSSIPGCVEFLKRHDGSRTVAGRAPALGFEARWKPKHYQTGYNFRFDALKFCRQGFIPHDAARLLPSAPSQLLCWLDGDVVTLKPVPAGYVEGLLPRGSAVAYLGRGDKHSEIGFQLYRIPDAASMLKEFRNLYDSDRVFNLKEWHSAFAFDIARTTTGTTGRDLTPGGFGHVWQQSPLRGLTDHLKGDRKKKG